MSLKPPKKSDKNKEWMKPRQDKRILVQPEYHLIVTEGKRTEPLYFMALKNAIDRKDGGRYKGKIDIQISGEASNTLDLLERAQKYVSSSLNDIKHVWIVYDKDDFPKDNFDNTKKRCEALSSSGKTTYNALWSNECFELWLLLHFQYMDSNISRDKYFDKLSKHMINSGLGEYNKTRTDIFECLRPRLSTAIDNARMLERKNLGLEPSACTPGTMVHKIMEKLEKYI
ncbi:MAG: RloB family protein [Clostridia bacterium]|nr:RloB family protein [Clostridia bacterium]